MFWAPCSSGEGQVGGGCLGGMGVSPYTCTHMHTHIYMHTHTSIHTHVYMYRNFKWPLTWRQPCLSCLTCMYMYAHVCVHTTPPTHTPIPTPTPINPPTTTLGTPGISKNSITLELIKIFQFCLKIWNLWRLPHPWVCVWSDGGWVGRWVDAWS